MTLAHEYATARASQADAGRRARSRFLLAGLIPSLWLLRRLPVGFFFMVGFWSAGAAATTWLAARYWSNRNYPRAIALRHWMALTFWIGVCLYLMTAVARFDARGDIPESTDVAARASAFALEVAVVVGIARRAALVRRPRAVASEVAPFVAATLIAIAGIALGKNLPFFAVVPIIAVVAVRMVTLPFDRLREDERLKPSVSDGLWFVWSASAIGLQSRVLTRPGGLVAMAVACVVGVGLLLVSGAHGRRTAVAFIASCTAFFIALMFIFTLLMPSLAGAEFLFRIGVNPVPRMSSSGVVTGPGRYERWYSTAVDRDDAIDLVSKAFRSPPVSVWPNSHGDGVYGLVFGYRIEMTYWDRGSSDLDAGSPCSTELHACVRLAVKRSTG